MRTYYDFSLRGLSKSDLVRWASDCAERVLPIYQRQSKDFVPHHAIEAARDWADCPCHEHDLLAYKARKAADQAVRYVSLHEAKAAAVSASAAAASVQMCGDNTPEVIDAAIYALESCGVDGRDIEYHWQLTRLVLVCGRGLSAGQRQIATSLLESGWTGQLSDLLEVTPGLVRGVVHSLDTDTKVGEAG